jgi:hypothetical protein
MKWQRMGNIPSSESGRQPNTVSREWIVKHCGFTFHPPENTSVFSELDWHAAYDWCEGQFGKGFVQFRLPDDEHDDGPPCTERVWGAVYGTFYFINLADATMFKLRWVNTGWEEFHPHDMLHHLR